MIEMRTTNEMVFIICTQRPLLDIQENLMDGWNQTCI